MVFRVEKGYDPISNKALLEENEALKKEIESLKTRLEDAEELKRAISEGDLDALVIPGSKGKLTFTLDSTDHAYRVLVETMNEGTVTFACDGTILYCNYRFAQMLGKHSQNIVSTSIHEYIAPEDAAFFKALLNQKISVGEIKLLDKGGKHVPVYLSISSLKFEDSPNAWCLVATDLTEQKKNEEIVASELLARSIIKQAVEAIIVCDDSGRITHFSNAASKICRRDPTFQKLEEILDLRVPEGEDAGKKILPVTSSLKGVPILGAESSIELKNNKTLHLLLNSSPLTNENGQIIGCVVTLNDITERRQIEENLRESEEIAQQRLIEIEELYRNAPIGLCMLDKELRYVRVNDRLAEINGIPAADHIGKTVRDIVPKVADIAEPMMLHVLRTGEPMLDLEITGETLTRPGIDRSWLERYLPITDSQGKITGLNIVVKEITERKEKEKALRESEHRLLIAKEAGNLGIHDYDITSGTIQWDSRVRELWGVEPDEFITYDIFMAGLHPDDRAITQNAVDKALDPTGDGKYYAEYRVINRNDGLERWIAANGQAFFEKSRAVRLVGTIQEITERKQDEKKLRENKEYFELLNETSSLLLSSKSPEAFIQNIAENVARNLDFDVFFNYIFDETRGKLHLNAYGGVSPEKAQEIEWLDMGIAICGCVAHEGERIVSENVQHNLDRRADLVRSIGVQAYACQPLQIGEKTVGTLSFGTKSRKSFSENELFLMRNIANKISVAIQRFRAEEALKDAYQNLEEKVKERTLELQKAYEALKESEKGLAEAQKMVHLGNWSWNPVTGEIDCSDETYRILGLKPKEFKLNYSILLDYVHPHDRIFVENALKEALTGKPLSIDFRINSADGVECVVHEQGEVIFNEENSTARIKGTIQDITERKKAEKLIKDNEDRLKVLFNLLPVGISITDKKRNILDVNPALENILGISRSDLLKGKHENRKYLKSDGTEMLLEEFPSVKALKEEGSIQSAEMGIIKEDGSTVWTDVSSIALPSSDGQVVIVTRDITESKKAEEKLQESEEKYRSFVQNLKGIAFQLDENSSIEFIHGATEEITGYTEQELTRGRLWEKLVLPEDMDIYLEGEKNALQAQEDYQGELEYRIRTKDGSIKWVYEIHQKNRSMNQNPTYTGIIHDITEKKEAEEALEKMDKMRIKEIHHRIKNNLQVISSLLSLEAERCNDEKMLEAFRQSQNRVASMALIHEELYKGNKKDTLDFATYLNRLTEDLFRSYNLKYNDIQLKLELESVYLDMDTAIPLGIIVNELISNSLKHAFPTENINGEIYVTLQKINALDAKDKISDPSLKQIGKNDFNYVLTITDNGKGVPEEIEFENTESLGFQLVNVLVEQIDGQIELRRGQGTKFIILFSNIEK